MIIETVQVEREEREISGEKRVKVCRRSVMCAKSTLVKCDIHERREFIERETTVRERERRQRKRQRG